MLNAACIRRPSNANAPMLITYARVRVPLATRYSSAWHHAAAAAAAAAAGGWWWWWWWWWISTYSISRNRNDHSAVQSIAYICVDYMSRASLPHWAHGIHPSHAIPIRIGGVEAIYGSKRELVYGLHVCSETSNTVLSLVRAYTRSLARSLSVELRDPPTNTTATTTPTTSTNDTALSAITRLYLRRYYAPRNSIRAS